MKRSLTTLFTIALLGTATPAAAQFSSNIPGVPRASLARLGGSQGRFEQELMWVRSPGVEQDTSAYSIRFGFGRSWRVASNFEIGYDLTVGEGRLIRTPDAGSDDPSNRLMTTLGYGLRVGAKVRPISFVDPEGRGVEVAIGAAIQPALEAAFWYESFQDQSWGGGQLGADHEQGDLHQGAQINAVSEFMVAASYRSDRITADAALVVQSADSASVSPISTYSGTGLRLGGLLRLTPGFALGASWWGNASPPWRDRVMVGVGEFEQPSMALVLRLGSLPDRGTDIIISSPTGSWSNSVSLLVRYH